MSDTLLEKSPQLNTANKSSNKVIFRVRTNPVTLSAFSSQSGKKKSNTAIQRINKEGLLWENKANLSII